MATTPSPALKTWSNIKELHSRLCELGAPIYGTKDVLFRRLCEYEQIAARKKKEEEYLETGREESAVAAEPVTPKILPGPVQPSYVERQHHMVRHLPPAPWCELCVMGRGKDDPQLRSDLREKGEQLLVIASVVRDTTRTWTAPCATMMRSCLWWVRWNGPCSTFQLQAVVRTAADNTDVHDDEKHVCGSRNVHKQPTM